MATALYGVKENDLESIKSELANLLGIEFSRHDSLYHGGDYYKFSEGSAACLILKKNIDLLDNEPAEKEFLKYQILLYVEGSARSEDFIHLLNSRNATFTLLRSQKRNS
jgi:hypothetical protein